MGMSMVDGAKEEVGEKDRDGTKDCCLQKAGGTNEKQRTNENWPRSAPSTRHSFEANFQKGFRFSPMEGGH
jgi:hypothetical protein